MKSLTKTEFNKYRKNLLSTKYDVPCPKCGEKDVGEVYDRDWEKDLHTLTYRCPNCDLHFDLVYKLDGIEILS